MIRIEERKQHTMSTTGVRDSLTLWCIETGMFAAHRSVVYIEARFVSTIVSKTLRIPIRDSHVFGNFYFCVLMAAHKCLPRRRVQGFYLQVRLQAAQYDQSHKCFTFGLIRRSGAAEVQERALLVELRSFPPGSIHRGRHLRLRLGDGTCSICM